jgi:phage-related tail fiber protein
VTTAQQLQVTVDQVLTDIHMIANGDFTDFAKNSQNLSGLTDFAVARQNLGLGNVNNTADLDKPVSTATQNALDGKANVGHTHDASNITSGVFSIDRIPSAVRNLNQGVTNQDPNLATDPVILTNHANSPSASYYWHITTTFYSTISSTSNRGQIAVQYNNGAQVYARSYYGGTWTAWQRLDNAGIPAASTSAAGVVQLSTSTASTSTTLAATASAVKAAYDRSVPDTSSKNTSGWVKFGNTGVIIQWGVSNASETGTTVTFPTAFPAACSSVVACYANSGDKISLGTVTPSTTSFKLYGWAYAAYWIAIGY